MSLQKNRLRSAKNAIFFLLCILVDRPVGGLNPQPPLCVHPWFGVTLPEIPFKWTPKIKFFELLEQESLFF